MNQRYHVLFAMFTILLSVQWQPAVCSEDDLSKLEEKTSKLKELLKLKELMRRVYGKNGDFDGINYESVLNEYLQQEQQNNKNDDNLNVYNEDESTINNVQDVDDELASNVSDDDGGAQSEQEKRSAYLRFGKRNPAYLRFGRSQAYLRFGKRAPSAYLRFGKRNPAYLRFGRSVEHSQPAAAAAAEQPKSAN